ncbi:MAG TPA: DUF2141 domain-containing protein [Sphingomicrobium sp.]|jgi:uncharacterized protein (DUF2141 family)|nr:DUF2141 domain-containing protein [Sphingomicrobium sp.]
MARFRAILLALPLLGGNAPTASVDVQVSGLRNARGLVQVCLTRDPGHFPSCDQDPRAVSQTIAAATAKLDVGGLPPGTYAIALFHDENSNRKLDKFMGVPREGFGFSRNPVIRFGPPKFEQVDINLAPGLTRQTVRVQYIL